VFEPDTESALYLLKNYLFPDEFLGMDIDAEAKVIQKISRRQLGAHALVRLCTLAQSSIGIVKRDDERLADRLTLNAWIAQIDLLESQMTPIRNELVRLAEQLPSFAIITSLGGVGETLGALFLAEVRDLARYNHFKQLEKLAGANLRLSQSGRYVGSRHISHIGNKRLLWILYKMTEETSKRVPEVRCKYLKRQLRRRKHRKNVIAAIPQLLQLVVALNRDKRLYEKREDTVNTMKELEQRYAALKAQSSSHPVKRITLRKSEASVL
jgi:transposase